MHVFALIALLAISGCGTIRKLGIRSATPLFTQSSQDLTKESDWDFFRELAPANLKFVELIYLQDQNNLPLLSVLIKGYAGLAFAVPETLAYGDELSGKDKSKWKKQAILHYTRAFDYGLEYLSRKDILRKDLLNLDEKKLTERLTDKLDDDDLIAVLYTAEAWGSLINLQKSNVALVSQVPKVKALFDWVCGTKPDIEHHICDIFYAQYEASRPRMLGGDPKKAEELYLAAIKKYPHHLLVRQAYMQYVLVPGFEQEKYEKEAAELRSEIEKWKGLNRDTLEDLSEYRRDHELNLFNAIAKKRFEFIEKYKQKIF